MSSRSKKDTVVIIKSINYSEADKIVTVIGKKYGKYTLIAKGVRKITSRNRASIQTLTISDISFFQKNGDVGSNLGLLKEANTHRHIITDYNQLKYVKPILFLLNKLLPEADSNEDIFTLIESLKFGSDEKANLKMTNLFILKALAQLGFIASIESCNLCDEKFDKENPAYIDKSNVLFICQHCYENNPIYSKSTKIAKLSGLGLESFSQILDNFIQKVYNNG